MTELELIGLLRETSTLIALDFEFFLTATFAVVVVSYTVGERLGKAPRAIIACLYLATVFMLFMRYQGAVSQAQFAISALKELGSSYPVLKIEILSWTRRFIFVTGALAAVYSLVKPIASSNKQKEGAGDQNT